MSIERDLILPGIMQRGGSWAVFSDGNPGYALALRDGLGASAEISVFERDQRSAKRLTETLTNAAGMPSKLGVQQGSVTQPQILHELDGVVAAQVLHDVPLDHHQQTLALLVSYLRHGGSLLFIEAEQRGGSLRVRNPVDYESFEYFAGLMDLRDVRRYALVPTGWRSMAYGALGFRA